MFQLQEASFSAPSAAFDDAAGKDIIWMPNLALLYALPAPFAPALNRGLILNPCPGGARFGSPSLNLA